MINQLLKLGALIATGRFLRPRLKGLLWVAAVWLLLWYAHSEYVEYVALSGDTGFVLKAALIKTGLYALSIGVYVLLVERPLWPRAVKMPPTPAAADSARPLQLPGDASFTDEAGTTSDARNDGFDFLRSKPKLKQPTDELLRKKS